MGVHQTKTIVPKYGFANMSQGDLKNIIGNTSSLANSHSTKSIIHSKNNSKLSSTNPYLAATSNNNSLLG